MNEETKQPTNDKIDDDLVKLLESDILIFDLGDGFKLFRGKIKSKKTNIEYPAWMMLCVTDSGEHYDTIVKINGMWKWQQTDDRGPDYCLSTEEREKILPYRYHLDAPCSGDIHTDSQY